MDKAEVDATGRDVGCNGICTSAADLGMPEYGGHGVIAYAHPECPVHGEKGEATDAPANDR